jgi:hypothetical protein
MNVQVSDKAYAGIGSRETPIEVCKVFMQVAKALSDKGYTLRSGHADGADMAFERGATKKQIFVPWEGFNGSDSRFFCISEGAKKIASKYHPAWSRCSQAAQKLHARNVFQILGEKLDSPVEFVLCWTLGGSGKGGTGQAIRIATDYCIPIIDFGRWSPGSLEGVTELRKLLGAANHG